MLEEATIARVIGLVMAIAPRTMVDLPTVGPPTADPPMVADLHMAVAGHPAAAITVAAITVAATDRANRQLLKQVVHEIRSGGTNLFRRFALVATRQMLSPYIRTVVIL